MANKEPLFASLHILIRSIPDGTADAGRRLSRYWYRESRCHVRTGWQKLCALCGYKSVKICVNPWLINDLRVCKVLYCCRDSFTDVVSALQIHLFMQNKAKFQKVKLNVNKVITNDYDQIDTWSIRKNKPKTNPIQTQYKANTNPNKPNLW